MTQSNFDKNIVEDEDFHSLVILVNNYDKLKHLKNDEKLILVSYQTVERFLKNNKAYSYMLDQLEDCGEEFEDIFKFVCKVVVIVGKNSGLTD